ncbi:MAG TPA: glycogen synthase GlgA [Candidatus Hydrogenedentes bacterium]|nr:glycogen synthase GlgA [Candidatus Hydrogenedentota bacterium]
MLYGAGFSLRNLLVKRRLKILFVTSELTPLVSTGGLADVAAALPRALHAQGCDVRVVMPRYRSIAGHYRGEPAGMCMADLGVKMEYGALRRTTAPGTKIPLYFIEHEGYFGRERPYGVGAYEYDDNAERFCFFSQAVLHGLAQNGWRPDVVHCNDWHTAPIPVFMRTRYRADAFWGRVPALFTIHNIAFQGRYSADKFASTGFEPWLFSPQYVECEGDMNLMKGAIAFATRLNTVSPRYAREIQTPEYGAGLDGMLRTRSGDLRGILNGVDYEHWNPATDPHIAANYDVDDLKGKAVCKRALQKTFGLPQRNAPVFGLVSRLYWQKGVDILADAMDRLAAMELQFVFLGAGDPELENRLADIARRHPDKVAARFSFDAPLAHQVQAGSDFFVMPSRYEPCGLSQLYSLAYGTVPVVRKTGGLADSVRDVNPVHWKRGDATGITFVPLTPEAILRAVRRAMELYADKKRLAKVRRAGMREDFSWDRSCREYIRLYEEAIAAA